MMFFRVVASNVLRCNIVSSSRWKPVLLGSHSLRFQSSDSSRSAPKPVKPETPVETAIREAKSEALKQSVTSADTVEDPPKKKTMWERVKHELVHYWHGTKLLGAEIAISNRLLIKLLHGQQISRREYRQLRRTTGDMLRIIPFVIILAIPFLEFALPFLLRIFPNMLPSTFESKSQEEAKKKALLKVRLDMAKFLQDTISEVAISGTSKSGAAKEFAEFFAKFRVTGELAPTEDVLQVARKFQDELTLSNLSRPQLVSMSKYLNMNAFGTDVFLRLQIQRRLQYLENDDRMIASEGVDTLTIPELQQVCLSRGIRTIGVSPARMRSELQQWLDLHLVHKIPASLLLLSQAFLISDRIPASSDEALKERATALQATLSALPHQVVNETQLKVSEAGGVATYKQKLDVLKEQEEMIADELEEEAAQEAANRARKESDSLKTQQELNANQPTTGEATEKTATLNALPNNAANDAPISAQHQADKSNQASDATARQTDPVNDTSVNSLGEEKSQPELAALLTKLDQHQENANLKLSPDELKKLGDAIKTISESSWSNVKEKLHDLKEDRKDFKEDIEEFIQVTQKTPSKSADLLSNRLDKMLLKIEKELGKYDAEIKLDVLQPDKDGKTISIQELEQVLSVMQNNQNNERIKQIVAELDSDGDGVIAMKEILALLNDVENESSKAEVKK